MELFTVTVLQVMGKHTGMGRQVVKIQLNQVRFLKKFVNN